MGILILEEEKSKEQDLIDEKEFKKRLEEANKKYEKEVIELLQILAENKVTWGIIVERNAENYSDRIAVKFKNSTLTYKEFNEWVNRYANYFISLGLKQGDVVEILVTNRPEYLVIFTAIGKIGAIGSLINTDLRESSLERCLNVVPGKIIIVDEKSFKAFDLVKSNLSTENEVKFLFLPDEGKISTPNEFIDLSQVVKDFPVNNPSTTFNVKSSDPLAYIFTSGTTGLPKASIFIHSRMVGSCYMIGLVVGELTPEDTMYIPLPLFHTTALCLGWAAAFGAGAAVALSRRFSVSQFWDDIQKFNATAFNYVGEMCRYLMNQPPSPNDSKNPVKTIIGNGLRPDIWKDFKKRFNITKVGEFYGASEIGLVFSNYLNFDCTVGYCANPYAIVKYNYDKETPIMNENGYMEKVNLGETGLLLWGLPEENIFVGYTDKEATEKKLFRNVFEEGDVWFNSGDLMRDQGCNHVQFIDRIGDTYRWKAHNVSTTEVEEVLNVFEQISMSSAYGVKIPGTDGRAGMASIVIDVNLGDFDFENLTEHLKKNLPYYAIPIFLRFKSHLSATATFKFRKLDLKKEAFDINIISEKIYVMLPDKSNFIALTPEIFNKIQNRQYKF
ncbi:MAG: long-chain-acyl-CoA synthetase [Candidatus Hodarchaeota archaeon]